MWKRFFLLHGPEDAGGSGGSGAGSGSGSGSGAAGGAGTGSGAGGAGTAGGAAGAGAPSHYDLTPDSLVKLPGMDAPVKYSDYAKGYVPRAEVGSLVREIIAAAGSRPQPQRQQQPQQQQVDPFAEIEAMPIVDGKTAAALARQIIQNGFGPRDKVIQALQKQIQDISGHVATSRTGGLQNDYAVSRDQIIATLPLPKLDRPIEGSKEALTEFIDGVFWKYDFEKRFADPNGRPHVVKEFGETVKKEFDLQRKFFRALEKADLEAAEEKSRKARFVRPTAQTGPNGKAHFTRESNAQKAKRFFGGSEPRT